MFIRNQYVVAGKMKTAIIKSFPELKYFLEKGLALQVRTSSFGRLNKIGRKFQELIDARRNELKQSLTDDDIQQLLNLREIVPAGCTMLFLPGFVQPILSFNIDRVPLFDSGWLFHATPGDNLTRIASSGFIEAPLSVIRMKKNYFSTRFASDSSARRLTDGIS
ncbi:hypothetical protein HY489_04380, partial [Candidatus Woesearchaeota archaeon]|nr:hypothetical protein [Candidatus Woesearchaeota archaeon]